MKKCPWCDEETKVIDQGFTLLGLTMCAKPVFMPYFRTVCPTCGKQFLFNEELKDLDENPSAGETISRQNL